MPHNDSRIIRKEFQVQISHLFDSLSEAPHKTPKIQSNKTLPETPPKIPPRIPDEVIAIILGYVKIDDHYGPDMMKFALVAKTWCELALPLLYTNLVFQSQEGLTKYVFWDGRYSAYGAMARTLRIASFSGTSKMNYDLVDLVKICPNIVSFKILNCHSTWVNDRVLSAMSTYWQHLVELSLCSRRLCDGDSLVAAIKSWPALIRLDLENCSGIDKDHYCEIVKLLPSLRSLCLSHIDKRRVDNPMSNNLLDEIANTCQELKVIKFNDCTPFTDQHILTCVNRLNDTLECLIITGCRHIKGITLAKIIAACDFLQFVDVSRSCFNDEALHYLSGSRTSVAPRVCPRIKQFAMSDCTKITKEPFRRFADVLGSHVRNQHVESCIVYVCGMTQNLPKLYIREIEEFNPGLKIRTNCNGFAVDKVIASIVGTMA